MRRLEALDNINKERSIGSNQKFHSIFEGHDNCRWSNWKNMNSPEMLKHVRDVVFPFIQNLNDGDDVLFARYLKDATFMILKPSLLQEAVEIFDKIDIAGRAYDVQGDVYELLLSEIQIAGKNGQFRTPRHIIKMIVELIDPKLGETICDPACGTGGFLISAYEHIIRENTSKDVIKYDEDGNAHNLVGDKITKKEHWNFLYNNSFYGFDFEYTMLRIGIMNMILHGIRHPNITYADSLSKRFDQTKQYDIILANPPFAGSVDKSDIHDNFIINSKDTELLFLELFYNILKIGGRAGVIVPTGVITGSGKVNQEIRKILLEKCQLEAIIYLTSNTFQPYAGVSTAVLIFTKGGKTDKVWLYEMENDGFSQDQKRTKIDANDISDVLGKFKDKKESKRSKLVSIVELKKNDYNLSVTRYIDNSVPEEKIDLQDTYNELKKVRKVRGKLEEVVNADLKKLGLKV